MGMFDDVYDLVEDKEFVVPCPQCGNTVTEFQSKDGDCTLSRIDWRECEDMLSQCEKCKLYLDLHIEKTEGNYVFVNDATRFDENDKAIVLEVVLTVPEKKTRQVMMQDVVGEKDFSTPGNGVVEDTSELPAGAFLQSVSVTQGWELIEISFFGRNLKLKAKNLSADPAKGAFKIVFSVEDGMPN